MERPTIDIRNLLPASEWTVDELRLTFAWRNDTERMAWGDSRPVTREEHGNWINRLQIGKERQGFLVKHEHKWLGIVSLKKIDSSRAEISIYLPPCMRGKGIGPQALDAAMLWAKEHWDCIGFVAVIMKYNGASEACFQKAGFKRTHEGYSTWYMEKICQ